ncbi:MAG TPA: SDR family oxidoreductase [Nocardioidaceae bacterium]|nr:SDR family oxidoreductase [Nocardioidaceae bacterium]
MVTGASRGIGSATAHQLSREGYRVVLVARDRDALDKVAAELPGAALVVPADVTDPAQVEDAFASVEREWQPVDVLVVNAGTGAASPLVDTTDEEWLRVLDLNLTAPFRCIRRALPPMLDQGWGRIVVVASVVSKRGESLISAYTASKHGVLGLVRSAAAEFARTGVTVNAVCPGYVDTPMTDGSVAAISARTGKSLEEAARLLARKQPIGRLITVEEVADAVSLLVRNGGINGQGINIDGGAVQS